MQTLCNHSIYWTINFLLQLYIIANVNSSKLYLYTHTRTQSYIHIYMCVLSICFLVKGTKLLKIVYSICIKIQLYFYFIYVTL